jgi:hypothetical protein
MLMKNTKYETHDSRDMIRASLEEDYRVEQPWRPEVSDQAIYLYTLYMHCYHDSHVDQAIRSPDIGSDLHQFFFAWSRRPCFLFSPFLQRFNVSCTQRVLSDNPLCISLDPGGIWTMYLHTPTLLTSHESTRDTSIIRVTTSHFPCHDQYPGSMQWWARSGGNSLSFRWAGPRTLYLRKSTRRCLAISYYGLTDSFKCVSFFYQPFAQVSTISRTISVGKFPIR